MIADILILCAAKAQELPIDLHNLHWYPSDITHQLIE